MTHHPNTPASSTEEAVPSVASGVEKDGAAIQADLNYENEHPSAKRMRLEFEAKYGRAASLMRAANHWFNVRTQWNEAWNRDREEPVTENDVAEAERAMLAAAAPGAAIAAREQEAHPEHARALAEHILSMDLATEKGKHARYLARKVLAKENESPAELALRSLASWLGCGGYNATAIDAGVMERRIRDAIASRQEATAASAEEATVWDYEVLSVDGHWSQESRTGEPPDSEMFVIRNLRKRTPLDTPRLQKLFGDAIEGALAFGFQGNNPPPEGHWLWRFWNIGRAEAAKGANPTAARSPATVAQPVGWQERQQTIDGWTSWYESRSTCTTGKTEAFALTSGGIPYEFRPLFAQPCPSQGCGGDGGEE